MLPHCLGNHLSAENGLINQVEGWRRDVLCWSPSVEQEPTPCQLAAAPRQLGSLLGWQILRHLRKNQRKRQISKIRSWCENSQYCEVCFFFQSSFFITQWSTNPKKILISLPPLVGICPSKVMWRHPYGRQHVAVVVVVFMIPSNARSQTKTVKGS